MPTLTATYTSPTTASPQTFSKSLPAISATSPTSDRVAYLATLQTSLKAIQKQVNTFLTQKMEEDKAAGLGPKADDAKEEENYGEEVVDAD